MLRSRGGEPRARPLDRRIRDPSLDTAANSWPMPNSRFTRVATPPAAAVPVHWHPRPGRTFRSLTRLLTPTSVSHPDAGTCILASPRRSLSNRAERRRETQDCDRRKSPAHPASAKSPCACAHSATTATPPLSTVGSSAWMRTCWTTCAPAASAAAGEAAGEARRACVSSTSPCSVHAPPRSTLLGTAACGSPPRHPVMSESSLHLPRPRACRCVFVRPERRRVHSDLTGH